MQQMAAFSWKNKMAAITKIVVLATVETQIWRKKILRAGFEPATYGCLTMYYYSPPLYQLSYRRKHNSIVAGKGYHLSLCCQSVLENYSTLSSTWMSFNNITSYPTPPERFTCFLKLFSNKVCIVRESNPGRPRGRRAFYHWTNDAG